MIAVLMNVLTKNLRVLLFTSQDLFQEDLFIHSFIIISPDKLATEFDGVKYLS